MLISEQIEQGIVAKMDNVLEIVSVGAVVAGLQAVSFRCIKWLKLYGVVNGNISVYSYDDNEVIFIVDNPSKEITRQTIVTIQRPLSLNGTLSNTKFEWARFEIDEREKLPFIWLTSPTQEVVSELSPTKTSNCTLWFVHWSDWSKLNRDRQDEAIEPLMNLVDSFINSVKSCSCVDKYEKYTTKDFPKFGTETPNGIDKTIFDSTLSAIEMKIDLTIFVNCLNGC